MSESWKNRLWSLLLVCTFAVVLSVCNKAVNSTSDGSSSSGTAFADGSTVTISSLPSVTVSSSPMPTVSNYVHCSMLNWNGTTKKYTYMYCEATGGTTVDGNGMISQSDLFSAGFRPCNIGVEDMSSGTVIGSFFFCK